MDLIFFFIIAMVVLSIIGFFIRVLLSIKAGMTIFRFAQQYDAWAQAVYNAQMEQILRQIAMAIQQQQEEARRAALVQEARQRMRTLGSQERQVYQNRLLDVESGRKRLDKETGEWVDG